MVSKLILFDVDGTLVLTGGAGSRALNRAFEAVFGAANAFDGLQLAGRTDHGLVHDALARLSIAPDGDKLRRFRDRYLASLAQEIKRPGPRKGILPGVEALLEALARRRDTFQALLTGNYAEGARIKLEHFGLWRYFPCGAFGDETADRNVLTAVAVEAARLHGVTGVRTRDVIVVGDTPLDVACAAAYGARAFAVATGGFDRAVLSGSGADVVFDDLSDTDAFVRLLD